MALPTAADPNAKTWLDMPDDDDDDDVTGNGVSGPVNTSSFDFVGSTKPPRSSLLLTLLDLGANVTDGSPTRVVVVVVVAVLLLLLLLR